jgi:kynurenine 3-monooxygenase
MDKPSKIAIVGAGPVGSCLAWILAKKGYRVDVFDKRSDPTIESKYEGRSVNLTLTVRAMLPIK